MMKYKTSRFSTTYHKAYIFVKVLKPLIFQNLAYFEQ